jgi:hypothetical protein
MGCTRAVREEPADLAKRSHFGHSSAEFAGHCVVVR